jgi:DNA polymerase III delta prime subunit
MDAKANILKCIKAVYKTSKDCEMKPSVLSGLKFELRSLSKELKLTQKQSFFFSIIFCKCISNTSVDQNKIIQHLNCEIVDFIEYQSDILKLIDKGYLNKVKERYRGQQSIMSESFKVNSTFQQAILEKKDLSTLSEVKIKNAVAFVDYIFALMKEVSEEDLDFSEAIKATQMNIKNNRHIAFIDTLVKSKLSAEDICILLYYIGSYRIGEKNECIKRLSINLYGENGTSSHLMQSMAAGNHILVKEKFLRNFKSSQYDEFEFELTGESKNIMRKYKIIPEFETKICSDTFDFLYTIESLYVQKENNTISTKELLSQVNNLLCSNGDLKVVKEVKKLNLKDIEQETIYLKTLYDGGTNIETSISTVTEAVCETQRDAVLLKNEFFQESNELIKNNLLELSEASFFSSAALRLTEVSQQILLDCGMELAVKQKNNYSISPNDIKSKPLFYNKEDACQMEMLRKILDERNFVEIQKRMAEKALATGIIALLYGEPGTGKTESVYQFAKETNREVIQVDISQSKSMWFGESEKQIKKIFTRYEQYSKRCKIKPVLLFNEADAIISKRKDTSSSNVAQTENAIQNILLEEFEKFKGICVATSNLINNLDPAFERRFLYKIELTKPNINTLSRIWESKLSHSDIYDISFLAKEYPFSGGQIDNIVKKIEMHEILHGAKPTHNEILSWCNAEKFEKNNRKQIGFN